MLPLGLSLVLLSIILHMKPDSNMQWTESVIKRGKIMWFKQHHVRKGERKARIRKQWQSYNTESPFTHGGSKEANNIAHQLIKAQTVSNSLSVGIKEKSKSSLALKRLCLVKHKGSNCGTNCTTLIKFCQDRCNMLTSHACIWTSLGNKLHVLFPLTFVWHLLAYLKMAEEGHLPECQWGQGTPEECHQVGGRLVG